MNFTSAGCTFFYNIRVPTFYKIQIPQVDKDIPCEISSNAPSHFLCPSYTKQKLHDRTYLSHAVTSLDVQGFATSLRHLQTV